VQSAGGRPADPERVADERRRLEESRVAVVPFAGDGYPGRLDAIPDPPLALFAVGRIEVLERFTVAVVGSRRCTSGGEGLAHRMGRDLATAGVVVVSGLAVGVDAAAHRGALDAGGTTIAVLGSGHDRLYPHQHRRLAAAIAVDGAVISEYPPDARAHRGQFPERNRIVSGLSTGVVVIEAGERSGSLITARLALEQGREVMAMPGSPAGGRSRGCHRLIQAGAALVEDAADVVCCLGLEPGRAPQPRAVEAPGVLEWIPFDAPTTVDALVERSGWSVEHVLESLAVLDLEGLVASVDGGYIRRPR
jgi:DNA processing protein